jgi:FtsZ-interacting cell division protein ZipA
MTTPDTTTPEATADENAAATATKAVETEPAAPAATSEAKADTEAPATDAAAPSPAEAVTETAVAVATPAVAETAVAAPAEAVEEEDPQTTVFSLLTFFLAALPIIGVVLNAIAVARAGKEGFDLWLARWGLALAIIETIGALALVGLGYYLGVLSVG